MPPNNTPQHQEIRLTDLAALGELVVQRRKELGLSLDEASARLGVGRRLLAEMEHGKRAVRSDTLIRMLNLFGFDVIARSRRPAE